VKRLNPENINNQDESERIFRDRWKEQLHYIDWERFKRLAKYYNGGNYLDIGCFNSPMPAELAMDKRFQGEIWALDHCKYVVDTLSKRYPQVNYVIGTATCLPFEDSYFSYAVVGELIEHLERPQDCIKEAVRVLKPGGILALSTPYKEEPGQISKEHLWSFDDNDIIDLLSPYGEIELVHYQDTTQVIIAYLKKNELSIL
jgi:ubiquinone/menaquinone biosynthesis C-methylase UbiE